MAEGTQEKVWTHRKDKTPLSGRGEEKGQATTIENSLHPSLCVLAPSSQRMEEQVQHLIQWEAEKLHYGPHPHLQEACTNPTQENLHVLAALQAIP